MSLPPGEARPAPRPPAAPAPPAPPAAHPASRPRCVMRVHLDLPPDLPPERGEALYGQALDLLQDITPLVEPVAPDTADLDVTGALPYWDLDPRGLAVLVQLRLAAHFGLASTCVGVAGNRLVAAMAAAVTAPGRATVIGTSPEEAARFLRPQPVAALPGVGPTTARRLRRLGVHTVGTLADLPVATLQRIVGAAAARGLHERANGRDPRPVVTRAFRPAATPLVREHAFPADELDPMRHRAALLALAEGLGAHLRLAHEVVDALTLTVRYADGSTSTRSGVLAEPTAHSLALLHRAYELYERMGLQRARVRAVALRGDGRRAQAGTARQLSLDPGDDAARAAEAAADRARARFGPHAVTRAALSSPTAGISGSRPPASRSGPCSW